MISVVISLFNKEKYIARAIDSVLNQTYPDFELIIVDDGSTDNGAEIAAGYKDPRVRSIRQPNGGASVARNRGIAEAKHELITFLDGDDAYNKNFLETIWRLRKQYPNAGAYATAYEICNLNTFKRQRFDGIPSGDWEGIIPNYFKTALGPSPICSSNVGIPKSTFATVGSFLPGLKRGEDLHMWLRIALRYSAAFSSYIGARYYIDSLGRGSNQYKVCASQILAKTIEEAFAEGIVAPHFQPYLKEYRNLSWLRDAYELILDGNIKQAHIILDQCKTELFWREKLRFRLLSRIPSPLMVFMRQVKKVMGFHP